MQPFQGSGFSLHADPRLRAQATRMSRSALKAHSTARASRKTRKTATFLASRPVLASVVPNRLLS